jgi:DNA (cytosine-5)-methyltransferase 1
VTGPRIGSLFAGFGGLNEGVRAVLGGEVAWHSEIDPGACRILGCRYPGVPNLGDITAVPWEVVAKEAPVDVLTGGFP